MGGLSISLLGSPRLERDGELVDLARRKNVALITYLAMTGTSHSRESLHPPLARTRTRPCAR